MKRIPVALALIAVAFGAAAAWATEPREHLGDLASLRALDTVPADAPAPVAACRAVFSRVNESQALAYLPTMSILRLEDSVAAAALRGSGIDVDSPADAEKDRRVDRLALAGWSAPVVAGEAIGYASKRVFTLSAVPFAGAVLGFFDR